MIASHVTLLMSRQYYQWARKSTHIKKTHELYLVKKKQNYKENNYKKKQMQRKSTSNYFLVYLL